MHEEETAVFSQRPFTRTASSCACKSSSKKLFFWSRNLMYRLKGRLQTSPSSRLRIRFFPICSFQVLEQKKVQSRISGRGRDTNQERDKRKKNGVRRESNSWNISNFVCIDSKNELDLPRKWEKSNFFSILLLSTSDARISSTSFFLFDSAI